MKKKKVDFLLGFRARECGGQGACGYNSVGVSMQLCKEPNYRFPAAAKLTHRGNFEKIHQHIGAYKADCEAAWIQDPQWTLTTEGGKVPTTFAEWLDSLLRPSRWIC